MLSLRATTTIVVVVAEDARGAALAVLADAAARERAARAALEAAVRGAVAAGADWGRWARHGRVPAGCPVLAGPVRADGGRPGRARDTGRAAPHRTGEADKAGNVCCRCG